MNAGGRRSGFTLLELLLVLTIVGIVAGSVVIGFAGIGEGRRVQAEAERLALAVELARGEALRRNEMWGLAVSENGYEFKRYDHDGGGWEALARRPFAPWTAADITFAVKAKPGEDEAGRQFRPVLDENERRPVDEAEGWPSVAIHPGGEVTPFDILVSAGDAPVWVAHSDGIARIRAARQEEIEKREFTVLTWQP